MEEDESMLMGVHQFLPCVWGFKVNLQGFDILVCEFEF